MGLSRKISAVPRGFVLGETIVYLAHRCSVVTRDDDIAAGIFSAFRPTGIDLVVEDLSRVPAKVEHLVEMIGADKNIRIVQVERDVDQQRDLFTLRDDEQEGDHDGADEEDSLG